MATSFQNAASSASLSKQCIGELANVPRGSHDTMSNRPSPHPESSGPAERTSSTPLWPGPPGLNHIEPMRWSGLVAG